jgi:glycosyltransferase involved in cell wall biosynthesis
MTDVKPNIGILSTFGHSTRSAGFLERLVVVESTLAEVLYVVSSDATWKGTNNVVFHQIKYEVGNKVIPQIYNQIVSQVKMTFQLVKLTRKVDFWIFYGGDTLLLPAIFAKLLRVKLLLALAGNLEKEAELKHNILNKPQLFMKRRVFALSDRIILFSEVLVEQWHLQKYKTKILIADSHFLDLGIYNISQRLSRRSKVVGYIGRLSNEKGVFNFIKAIPLVLQRDPDIKFIIVGDGPLWDDVSAFISTEKIGNSIKLIERVAPNMVPTYLNQLKLCVLPSYTEGMPNIVLEAMACGTPVLSTPVGAVTDLIKDGDTGFIMENNLPETIADNILRALSYKNLDKVTESARRFVEQNFTFEKAQQSYKHVAILVSQR